MQTTTTNPSIFKNMDTDSILRNHACYVEALSNPRQADSWPALKYGLDLCRAEMKERGIDITKYPINKN